MTDELRPPCWKPGTKCPNDCAARHHQQVVYNHQALNGPWAGWRLAGARLVAPGGEWIAPHQLDRWLWRYARMFED